MVSPLGLSWNTFEEIVRKWLDVFESWGLVEV